MLSLIVLLFLGVPVGLVSGLLGIGGGVFVVPIFYSLFPNYPAHAVVATSLATIFVNNLITNYNFYKQGRIPQKKIFLPMILAISLGSLIGQQISFLFDEETLKKVFASVLLALTIQMWLTRKVKGREEEPATLKGKENIYSSGSALIAGIFGGITGLGGGVIMVPILNLLCKMRMHWVVVYSNLAIGVGTLTALLAFALTPLHNPFPNGSLLSLTQYGHINAAMVLLTVPGAFLGSRIGAKLGRKLDQKTIKLIFAGLLVLISLKIFLKL